MPNDDLIAAAQAIVHPHRVGDRLFGDVGAALITEDGNVYAGVCIDTEVVLGRGRAALLRELLPAHEWPDPLG
ncbi:hypothetical protein [Catenulispora sp. GAS73]|uniref:hypothetical protein n=1 Tax=Catenulispora sp. GAS73 TaxID=3156269 RepID=UPI0035157D0B